MAQAERKYTREYTYMAPSSYTSDFLRSMAPEPEWERHYNTLPNRDRKVGVKREDSSHLRRSNTLREVETAEDSKEKAILNHKVTFRIIGMFLAIGALLVGIVWLNAEATNVQYSINQVNRANLVLENEIKMINIELQDSNSIGVIEDYAIDELNMRYPANAQRIYLDDGVKKIKNLTKAIRKRAY